MTIIIPKTIKNHNALVCLFDPPTGKASISFTLEDETIPFREGKINRRSTEICAFMFRPRTLDIEKSKFTEPLKKGNVINVKVILNGNSHSPETKDQKVTIK